MKKLSLFLTLSIILVVQTAFGQQQFSNDEFAIEYPANWSLDTSGIMGTQLMIISEIEKDDQFRENINLIIQDLPTYDISLDDYTSISEKQIKDAFGENSIMESKRENGKHKIVYKGTQQGIEMIFEQIYIIKNNKAYVLTFTSIPATYEKFKAPAEKILESFKVK
ncbi:MAG TPA: hypothetical protein DIU39_05645 [Flavobacteriales bacterium]|nr:hypothetical protein [Flavobacteriales bacterium]